LASDVQRDDRKMQLARIWVGTALRIRTATLPHVAVLL
jgi:hypothetical protein